MNFLRGAKVSCADFSGICFAIATIPFSYRTVGHFVGRSDSLDCHYGALKQKYGNFVWGTAPTPPPPLPARGFTLVYMILLLYTRTGRSDNIAYVSLAGGVLSGCSVCGDGA
jgi:hypothetical protein